MAWKLAVVVLVALQLGYLQAQEEQHDASNSLLNAIVNQMTQGGGDGGHGMDQMSGEEMLKAYIHYNNIQPERPFDSFFGGLRNLGQLEVGIYRLLQAQDLITKSVIENIFETERGVDDFAKELIFKHLEEWVEKAGEEKMFMAELFDFLLMHPKSEQREMAMKLLFTVTSQLSHDDRSVIRIMLLRLMTITQGDMKEVVREMYYGMMSDEMGAHDITNTEMLALLGQHLMTRIYKDNEKRDMGIMIMHGLASRKDEQGQKMLRDLINTVIYYGSTPGELKEEDVWKFVPFGPCRIDDQSGNNVMEVPCAHDMECDVGPVTSTLEGNTYRYTMCRPEKEMLGYFAFHSCEVTYPDGKVETRPNCDDGQCNFGPFSMTIDDETYQAKFCQNYNDFNANLSSIDPMLFVTCALTDPSSAMRVYQRKCPYGYACTSVPKWVQSEGQWLEAQVCEPQGLSERDLLLELADASLGFEKEEEADQMMMGGDEAVEIASSEQRFTELILKAMMHHNQNSGEEEEMSQNDQDMFSWKVLHYLDEMAGEHRVMGATPMRGLLQLFEDRHGLGLTSDVDRVIMGAAITHLIQEGHRAQQGSESEEEESDEDNYRGGRGGNGRGQLMDMLRDFAQQHEKHTEHHYELDERVKYLQDALYKLMEDRDGGDDHHSEEEDDAAKKLQQQVMEALLERFMNGEH